MTKRTFEEKVRGAEHLRDALHAYLRVEFPVGAAVWWRNAWTPTIHEGKVVGHAGARLEVRSRAGAEPIPINISDLVRGIEP